MQGQLRAEPERIEAAAGRLGTTAGSLASVDLGGPLAEAAAALPGSDTAGRSALIVSIPTASVPVLLMPVPPLVRPILGGLVPHHVNVCTPLPDFDVSVRDERWRYFLADTMPAYTALLDEPGRPTIEEEMARPLEQRIAWARPARGSTGARVGSSGDGVGFTGAQLGHLTASIDIQLSDVDTDVAIDGDFLRDLAGLAQTTHTGTASPPGGTTRCGQARRLTSGLPRLDVCPRAVPTGGAWPPPTAPVDGVRPLDG